MGSSGGYQPTFNWQPPSRYLCFPTKLLPLSVFYHLSLNGKYVFLLWKAGSIQVPTIGCVCLFACLLCLANYQPSRSRTLSLQKRLGWGTIKRVDCRTVQSYSWFPHGPVSELASSCLTLSLCIVSPLFQTKKVKFIAKFEFFLWTVSCIWKKLYWIFSSFPSLSGHPLDLRTQADLAWTNVLASKIVPPSPFFLLLHLSSAGLAFLKCPSTPVLCSNTSHGSHFLSGKKKKSF